MPKLMTTGAALIAAVLFLGATDEKQLDGILEGDHRSAENRARDAWRHPAETLAFLGVKPDHTVVELWPGGGWYTEILAPLVRDSGKLYAAGFPESSDIEYYQRGRKRLAEKLASRPDVYGNVEVTALGKGTYDIAPPGSADAVLTFRNLHNWMRGGYVEDVFSAAHRALRPGGTLGIVEHRAPAGTEQDPKAENGYVTQAYTIALAEAAGFELVGSSEINANPRDTADHPGGVWTLPPSLRLKDENREKYVAIGESDRMTLRFRKK